MEDFLLVQRKNDDDFFIRIEEKKWKNFFTLLFLCTPIDKTIQKFFLQNKIFFPVYPNDIVYFSLFFTWLWRVRGFWHQMPFCTLLGCLFDLFCILKL